MSVAFARSCEIKVDGGSPVEVSEKTKEIPGVPKKSTQV